MYGKEYIEWLEAERDIRRARIEQQARLLEQLRYLPQVADGGLTRLFGSPFCR